MKKYLFLIVAFLGLMSCSSDNDSDNGVFNGTLTGGLYAYYGNKYAVAIGTTSKDGWSFDTYCEPGYISIMDLSTGGEYVFSQTQGIINIYMENYNNGTICSGYGWEYNNGLSILCIPKSANSFTGKVLKNTSGISLPDEMEFTLIK